MADDGLPKTPPDPAPSIAAIRGLLVGRDVFIVGSGPSLHGFDWELLAGRQTIALNGAGLWFAPTVWLFNDVELWKQYIKQPKRVGTAVVCQGAAAAHFVAAGWRGVFSYVKTGTPTTSVYSVDSLYCRSTVATAGVHLAWRLGARRIFLLGVDAYREPRNSRGLYYADGSPQTKINPALTSLAGREPDGREYEARHEDWRKDMVVLRGWLTDKGRMRLEPWPGSGVFNLSERSRIDAWQKTSVKDALAEAPSAVLAEK